MQHPTGITYQHQFGGTACLHGEVEGYLVPVCATHAMPVLRTIFEAELKGAGVWSWNPAFGMPPELLARVRSAVESIQFWPADDAPPEMLSVDPNRISEIDEAWVPVSTSDGPGVFVWTNSD